MTPFTRVYIRGQIPQPLFLNSTKTHPIEKIWKKMKTRISLILRIIMILHTCAKPHWNLIETTCKNTPKLPASHHHPPGQPGERHRWRDGAQSDNYGRGRQSKDRRSPLRHQQAHQERPIEAVTDRRCTTAKACIMPCLRPMSRRRWRLWRRETRNLRKMEWRTRPWRLTLVRVLLKGRWLRRRSVVWIKLFVILP